MAQLGPGVIGIEPGQENQKEPEPKPESTVSVITTTPPGAEQKSQQKVAASGQRLTRVPPNGTIVGKETKPA